MSDQTRLRDFAGTRLIGVDNMAFGWPSRYVQLDLASVPSAKDGAPPAAHFDTSLMQLASYFESRVRYDFLTWNCHSFVASCLNEVKYPRSRLASALGGWSVVSLALFIFIWGRHIGPCGWLKQWGGSFATFFSGGTFGHLF